MWPVGSPAPLVASAVWTNGEKPTNVITVPISADGRINLFSGFQAKYTVRVVGWFTTPTLSGSTFTYDKNGNRVKELDAATGVETNFVWDELDRLISVSKGIPGAPANIITETPTIAGGLYHAWWGAAVTAGSPSGVNVPTTVERNAFSGLSVTPGSYELEFTGAAAAAVNVTPYLVFHQNWANYVEPVERVTSPQGQLTPKPWTGTRKWAVTVPAAQNGAPLTHADLRLVGTGAFNLGTVVLRRVTPPSEVNVYDADGARIVRKDPNGTITVFLDGQEIVANAGANTVVSASRYYAGSSTLAVRSTTGGLNYLGADHQGTVMATLTTTGVSTRQRYKPFGGQRGTSNALSTERGFIGQVEDKAVGLVYLNARHYDPTNAIFVSVDPLPTGYSYLYGSGNPVVNSDPTGLCDNCSQLVGGYINWNSHTVRDPDRDYWHDPFGPEVPRVTDAWVDDWNLLAPPAIKFRIGNDVWRLEKGEQLPVCYSITGQKCSPFYTPLMALDQLRWFCVDDPASCSSTSSREFRVTVVLILAGVYGAKMDPACRGNSFTPETRVLMADGSSKRIEDVKIGDRVVAFDPEIGERGIRSVTATIVGDGVKQLVGVQVRTSAGESTIWATAQHPFWDPASRTWVEAGDLRIGSMLLTNDGDFVTLAGLTEVVRVQRVHNLTVDGVHTYYVLAGDEHVLVHNCSGEMRARKTPETPSSPPKLTKEGGHYAEVTDRNVTAATRRIMDEHFGKGNWSGTGPTSDYNILKKWLSRTFVWS
jgi:RHS repeat-associated protein